MKKINLKKIKYFLTILLVGVVIFATACSSFAQEHKGKEGGSMDMAKNALDSALFPNGRFVRTGDMTISRRNHASTLLQDGRVLITGGYSADVKYELTASAEIYDPKIGKFIKISDMTENRANHTSTLLPNGRVLITGGGRNSSSYIASAEIYDPRSNTFNKTGDMHLGRNGHQAVLLNNGKVLIIGGGLSLKPPIPPNIDPSILNPEVRKFEHYGELYNPKTGEFTFTEKNKGDYAYLALAMLPGNRVLLVGSYGDKIAEIYDSEKNQFIQTDLTTKPFYGTTATLLNNNKVLVASSPQDNYADLYDIKKRRFKAAKGKLHGFLYNNSHLTSTLLDNGNVLIIGFDIKGGYENLYITKLDMFILTPRMNNAVINHTATKLKNGDVLITGGSGRVKGSKNNYAVFKKAELYKY